MRIDDLKESFASSAFREKLKTMDRAGLERLRGDLKVRQERRRMKFSRTRSITDGEAYRRTSAELGEVNTAIRLLKEPISESIDQWPAVLQDSREIARYIDSISSDYVDEELIEEYLMGCKAVLKEFPVASISEGDPDHNIADRAKQRAYATLDPSTRPPIVIKDNDVIDGNHRFRDAVARGAETIWAYDVVDDDTPDALN